MRDKLRMWQWFLSSNLLLLVLWLSAPQQLPVVTYKLALIALFAYDGYWIDRTLFPYARPHDFMANSCDQAAFNAAQLRRAIIVGAVILAGALAL